MTVAYEGFLLENSMSRFTADSESPERDINHDALTNSKEQRIPIGVFQDTHLPAVGRVHLSSQRMTRTLISQRTRLIRFLIFLVSLVSKTRVLAYYNKSPISARRQPVFSSGNDQASLLLTTTACMAQMADSDEDTGDIERRENGEKMSKRERELFSRLTRLEAFVAKQEVEIHRLKNTCDDLTESTLAFARVIQMLRQAGLQSNEIPLDGLKPEEQASNVAEPFRKKIFESYDDSLVFGTAPSSVIDAADSAGAAILAAMLGGKQRMLVDVRDAELSRDPEILVQFIELAILPVAAGLEGLKSTRNRVKIVFPKVSQLLEYRRTMALAAPEVVALSTLGFDPVEKRDKLVVIVAPAPDDEEGLKAMKELLSPTNPDQMPIQQPVVILNYHMVPVSDLSADFVTAYHLRLLSVQYMSGETAQGYFQQFEDQIAEKRAESKYTVERSGTGDLKDSSDMNGKKLGELELEDEALEAAMKHAHDIGMNEGSTRAMVIRAYPR
jgi:hypothetical protein